MILRLVEDEEAPIHRPQPADEHGRQEELTHLPTCWEWIIISLDTRMCSHAGTVKTGELALPPVLVRPGCLHASRASDSSARRAGLRWGGAHPTPIRTVEELLACRPARMEPMPGKNMFKMKQQMPVDLGTEGTWRRWDKDAQVSPAVACGCAMPPCPRLHPTAGPGRSRRVRADPGTSLLPRARKLQRTRGHAQHLLLAQVNACVLAELHLHTSPALDSNGSGGRAAPIAARSCDKALTPPAVQAPPCRSSWLRPNHG